MTIDQINRDIIIDEINTNLFVMAGAGSGKTTMLVNRMVAMVESGIPIDKICAITFTKNAALEFYQRFQAKLIERINDPKPKERAGDLNDITLEKQQYDRIALANIDLCFMGTIDSFCNMVLSEHPSLANLPTDIKLLSKDEELEIYRQFFIDVKNDKNHPLNKKANLFSKFYNDATNNYAEMMKLIMRNRDKKFIFENNYVGLEFYSIFKTYIDDLRKVLDSFDSNYVYTDGKQEEKNKFVNNRNNIKRRWLENYKSILSSLDYLKDIKCNNLYTTNLDPSLKTLIIQDDVVYLNIGKKEFDFVLIDELREYRYQNTMDLLINSISYLQQYTKENGLFTYFDYLFYLRNLLNEDLKNGGKLIEYISFRHSYFLIDEFQDTSISQTELFFNLASSSFDSDDWRKNPLRDGALFVVGDKKQSIYRFRGADIDNYQIIEELFNKMKNGKVVKLTDNFRSSSSLKNYFNETFNKFIDDYDDITNGDTNNNQQEFNGIYSYKTVNESIDDEDRIVELVKLIVNNPNYQIMENDKKQKNYQQLRMIKYSDIMIITPNKTKLASYISSLKENNIEVFVEGKVMFSLCKSFVDITNIYKAVSDVTDTTSLICALKSKVFNVSDDEIINEPKNLYLSYRAGTFNLDKAINRLYSLHEEIDKYTISSLYQHIIDEFEIFKYVDTDNLEITYYVLELLENKQHTNEITTFLQANNFFNELLDADNEIERCLSLKKNNDAVHLANVHKVKGLEAPVVILTKAGNSNKAPDIRFDNDKGYLFYFKNSTGYTNLAETTKFSDYQQLEKEASKKEEDRIKYVAATRARNVLIINEAYTKTNRKMGNKWKELKEGINDYLLENEEFNSNVVKEKAKVNASSLFDTEKVIFNNQSTYQFVSPSELSSNKKVVEDNYQQQDNSLATLKGTVAHRLMELIINSKDSLKKDHLIDNIINEYVDNDQDLIREMLSDIYDTMHQTGYKQNGKVRQDILSVLLNAKEVYCEVPFTFKEDDNIYNGIIDLIYLDDDGYHIIDWKTNKSDFNLDEHYKEQLDVYIKAANNNGIKVVDAYIYHLDIKGE